MGAMPSPAQSRLYAGLLPVEHSVEAPAVYADDLKNDWFASEQPSSSRRSTRPLPHFLIIFCTGVAATVAWQSYSDVARQIIARASPQLSWLAPQPAVAQTVPGTIEQITRSVNRIVAANQEQIARSVDRIIATSQEQVARSVAQLAADQEQMTREIIELRAISQYGLYKNAEPPPRRAPSTAPKPVTRPVH